MGPSSHSCHPRAPPACTSGRVSATAPPLPRWQHSVRSRRRESHCRAAPSEQSPWGAAPAVSLATPHLPAAAGDEGPAADTAASEPAAAAATAAAGPAAVAGGGGALPWLALQPPFTYMASAEAALSDTAPSGLAPMWKLLLLSDGSVTRHLQLLSGAPVTVECLSMAPVGQGLEGCPPGTQLIPGPRVQRQVLLRCKPTTAPTSSPPPSAPGAAESRLPPQPQLQPQPADPTTDPAPAPAPATDPATVAAAAAAAASGQGLPLVYAASWWAAETVDTYLADRSQPIWISLSQGHVELYREVHALFRGQAPPELEELMGCKGPFWGRHYVFWSAGKPLTLIYEVFSPRLGAWLGPQAAPGSSGDWAGGELEEGGEQ
ncbi:hypothetical protein HXX76_013903 [Chlamydomonas incerta]|uniref:DUF98 domain-containing protein n=1 Tax=Chlamydomonas incerta TaxID=51695 RepID=A0A835SMV8_CHLIN|nr:hypothetical protein HXX76_013903 [Chlamydomonas incerta]|eukprot:KAG2425149.1 hypothetical protein HXX76_013903 [Chlamydomonas incerta]